MSWGMGGGGNGGGWGGGGGGVGACLSSRLKRKGTSNSSGEIEPAISISRAIARVFDRCGWTVRC